MSTGVLLAVSGAREADLVQLLDAPGTGVRVVRRCADAPEVLAAAMAGLGAVAVLSGDLAGVDRTLVARLATAGVRTVLIAADGDVERCRGLGAHAVLDVRSPVTAWAEAAQAAAVPEARREEDDVPGTGSDGGGLGAGGLADADPVVTGSSGGAQPGPGSAGSAAAGGSSGAAMTTDVPAGSPERVRDDRASGKRRADADGSPFADPPRGEVAPEDDEARRGRLVVVWGPPGAPGRTTVAVNLAAELAAAGESCLLVDADTEAPSVAQVLGLLDETAGIAAAARAAANGRLDRDALARACLAVDGFRVLSGLTRADRWRELAPSSLEVVWDQARDLAAWTVVDTGSGTEGAGVGADASFGPRRHQATLAALAAADVVIVVGAGEPVGIHRLVSALHDLADRGVLSPGVERVVLVNRVRASAAGPQPERSIHEALVRFAGVGDAILVPDDRAVLDRCVLAGQSLAQGAQGSPARAALADLAGRLTGTPMTRKERRRAARTRRRGQH